MGVIINIILKQSKVKGINGNISFTAGTGMKNGSFNLTTRNGNFGINVFMSGNTWPYFNVSPTSDLATTDSVNKKNVLLQQSGLSHVLRHGAESGVGFDRTYKKKNNFSGSVHYNIFGNRSTSLVNQSQVTTAMGMGNILSNITTINHAANNVGSQTVDAKINYKRMFDKKDQELDVSINSNKRHQPWQGQ